MRQRLPIPIPVVLNSFETGTASHATELGGRVAGRVVREALTWAASSGN